MVVIEFLQKSIDKSRHGRRLLESFNFDFMSGLLFCLWCVVLGHCTFDGIVKLHRKAWRVRKVMELDALTEPHKIPPENVKLQRLLRLIREISCFPPEK